MFFVALQCMSLCERITLNYTIVTAFYVKDMLLYNFLCSCLEMWMCSAQSGRKDFLTHGSYDVTRILAYLEEEHSVWALCCNPSHDWSSFPPLCFPCYVNASLIGISHISMSIFKIIFFISACFYIQFILLALVCLDLLLLIKNNTT